MSAQMKYTAKLIMKDLEVTTVKQKKTANWLICIISQYFMCTFKNSVIELGL